MAITKRGFILGATALASAAFVITGANLHVSNGQAFFSDNNPKELVDEVWQLIDHEYVDDSFNTLDWNSVRSDYLNRTYTDKEEAYVAVREMLEQLDDPYTRFMDPEEFRNMQIDTSGELTGVGIQISQDEETNDIVVVSPIEDTPAFDAGLLSGDGIEFIDGQGTEGMELSDAVTLIRDEGSVGYIRLTQFSANAAAEMKDAIESLEDRDVTGYVLDLRSNPGGLLFSSIDIAQMFNHGILFVRHQ